MMKLVKLLRKHTQKILSISTIILESRMSVFKQTKTSGKAMRNITQQQAKQMASHEKVHIDGI